MSITRLVLAAALAAASVACGYDVIRERPDSNGDLGLVLSSEEIDFGSVRVGEVGGPLSLLITNEGQQVRTIDAISMPPPFRVTNFSASVSLLPDAGFAVSVTFEPATVGTSTELLTITLADGERVTATMRGTAVSTCTPDCSGRE